MWRPSRSRISSGWKGILIGLRKTLEEGPQARALCCYFLPLTAGRLCLQVHVRSLPLFLLRLLNTHPLVHSECCFDETWCGLMWMCSSALPSLAFFVWTASRMGSMMDMTFACFKLAVAAATAETIRLYGQKAFAQCTQEHKTLVTP